MVHAVCLPIFVSCIISHHITWHHTISYGIWHFHDVRDSLCRETVNIYTGKWVSILHKMWSNRIYGFYAVFIRWYPIQYIRIQWGSNDLINRNQIMTKQNLRQIDITTESVYEIGPDREFADSFGFRAICQLLCFHPYLIITSVLTKDNWK